MSYKNILDIWDKYEDLHGRYTLNVDPDHNLVVSESVSFNVVCVFYPKAKPAYIIECLEILGFTIKK